jgi:hypothetical protein
MYVIRPEMIGLMCLALFSDTNPTHYILRDCSKAPKRHTTDTSCHPDLVALIDTTPTPTDLTWVNLEAVVAFHMC